jgi:hypothetical protein
MNKIITTTLFLSVLFTSLFSALFGLVGQTFGGTFWGWFWVTWLGQFLGFVCYNSYLIQRDNIAFQTAETKILEELSKFSVKLTCAYCQQTNVTPIQLNQKNTFKCEGCNQVNGVSMQFMATTLTTPIQSVKIPVLDQSEVEFKIT